MGCDKEKSAAEHAGGPQRVWSRYVEKGIFTDQVRGGAALSRREGAGFGRAEASSTL